LEQTVTNIKVAFVGVRYRAEQALLSVRGEPAQLADIDDSLQSMKLVADIFGLAG
jgi:hypothetical protein